MKAFLTFSRAGQIIILAIAFMACVGWNQASGLQNNISSMSQKRIKDMVRIRYVLPYTNLHTVPKPCPMNLSEAAFDGQNGTSNLNNRSISNSAEKMGKQDTRSCLLTQSSLLKQTDMESSSLSVPVFCQSKLSIADAFQGQGYFSGFASSSASAHFTAYTGQTGGDDAPAALLSTGTSTLDTNNSNVVNEYPEEESTATQPAGTVLGCASSK